MLPWIVTQTKHMNPKLQTSNHLYAIHIRECVLRAMTELGQWQERNFTLSVIYTLSILGFKF